MFPTSWRHRSNTVRLNRAKPSPCSAKLAHTEKARRSRALIPARSPVVAELSVIARGVSEFGHWPDGPDCGEARPAWGAIPSRRRLLSLRGKCESHFEAVRQDTDNLLHAYGIGRTAPIPSRGCPEGCESAKGLAVDRDGGSRQGGLAQRHLVGRVAVRRMHARMSVSLCKAPSLSDLGNNESAVAGGSIRFVSERLEASLHGDPVSPGATGTHRTECGSCR